MAGKKGFGAKFKYRSALGPPEVFTAIADCTRIRPFGAKVDSVDVSSQDSPGEYREKIPGFKDAGEASFDLNYDESNATHVWLFAHIGGTVEKFQVLLASGVTITFSGFITGLSPEIPHDGKQTCTVTINVTSVPVFA